MNDNVIEFGRPSSTPDVGVPAGAGRQQDGCWAIPAAKYVVEPPLGPRRSEPGKGPPCMIYVLGPASKHADSIVPAFGETAGCGPNLREDFAADTMWPVVIKAKVEVGDEQLVRHLRDLADLIESHPAMTARERLLTWRQRWGLDSAPTEPRPIDDLDIPF